MYAKKVGGGSRPPPPPNATDEIQKGNLQSIYIYEDDSSFMEFFFNKGIITFITL